MWSKRETVVAVTCLALGSAGQLVQCVVTPLGSEDSSAADNVARAVAHPVAMQWAAWLDLTILFFLPALVVVAYLARARTTRLGWAAAVLAIATSLPGVAYVLAPDVLFAEAAHGHVGAGAIAAYDNSALVTLSSLVFIVGHVLGLILLAVALWRAGSVPRWAAVCLALSPILEVGGQAAAVRPVSVLAYLLLMAAFGACALAVARPGTPATASPTPAPVSLGG